MIRTAAYKDPWSSGPRVFCNQRGIDMTEDYKLAYIKGLATEAKDPEKLRWQAFIVKLTSVMYDLSPEAQIGFLRTLSSMSINVEDNNIVSSPEANYWGGYHEAKKTEFMVIWRGAGLFKDKPDAASLEGWYFYQLNNGGIEEHGPYRTSYEAYQSGLEKYNKE